MQRLYEHSILDVADELQIKYSKNGNYRRCLCFMHNDRTPSMWLKVSTKSWCCPVCDKKGGMISLVQEKLNYSREDAIDWLLKKFDIYDVHEPYRPPQSRYRKYKRKAEDANATPAVLTDQASVFLNSELLKSCFNTNSLFCRSMVTNNILTVNQMQAAAQRYHLGLTCDGGVIFWQIDQQGQVHDGKIMFYKPDCHRDHAHNPSWVSHRLKKKGSLNVGFQPTHCLFGLHLLVPTTQGTQTIAIVESEKTAVICSQLYPSVVWMATGGLSNFSVQLLTPLKGRQVIIFPDTDPKGDTFQKWANIAADASKTLHTQFLTSNILEHHATPDQKARKIDIADYIIESRM